MSAALMFVPGVRVRRLGAGTLEVGLDPLRRVRVTDTDRHRQLLRQLRDPTQGEADADHQMVRRLRDERLVVTAADLRQSRERVAQFQVAVLGEQTDHISTLVRERGLRAATSTSPDIAIVLDQRPRVIEQSRMLSEQAIPHVTAWVVGEVAWIGPFVAPGETPCLDCVEMQLQAADPLWQSSQSSLLDLPVSGPAYTLAGSWLVRDVVTWLRGERPWTWARTIALGPSPEHSQVRTWRSNPECACTWS